MVRWVGLGGRAELEKGGAWRRGGDYRGRAGPEPQKKKNVGLSERQAV